MRHDEERPRTGEFLDATAVPADWQDVLDRLRRHPHTSLTSDDILAEATSLLLISPSPQVTAACLTELLTAVDPAEAGGRRGTRPAAEQPPSRGSTAFAEVLTTAEALVPADVPAGTWILVPHRSDGWAEAEATSAMVRSGLTRENTARASEDTFTVIEYGINLWLWAEPPAVGGDSVCHAGELISWESAWALDAQADARNAPAASAWAVGQRSSAASATTGSDDEIPVSSRRPPIFFGLPPVLRRRRMDG